MVRKGREAYGSQWVPEKGASEASKRDTVHDFPGATALGWEFLRGTLSQESVNDGAGRRPTEGAAAVVRREPGEQRA